MKTTIKSVTKFFIFENDDGYEVLIEGFSEGFVEIEVPITLSRGESQISIYSIDESKFISFIAGSFAKDSNFKEKVFRAYGFSSDTEFCGFKLRINEDYCFITKDNSSLFKIKESIINLVYKFTQRIEAQTKAEISEYNSKVDALEKVFESVEEIYFKNDRAEELYERAVEQIEEELSGFGVDFIAYVQSFIGKGKSIHEIVQEAINIFEDVGWQIDEEISEVQLICKYCKYGDEIYEAYLDIQSKRFGDELEDF